MSKVIAPKTGKRLMNFVPEAQMHHLLDGGIFDNDFSGVRDRLILEMLYLTGMRRSELIHLKNGDVYMGSRYVRVLGKGRKERNIPIPDGLVGLIREYLDLRASEFGTLGTDRLFVTDKGQELYPKFVYNKVRHYLSLVTTLERKSPHVIRHSFATHLSNKGAELNAIKTLLGHQSLAATQIYTHNDIAKLKAVYEKSHPKAR